MSPAIHILAKDLRKLAPLVLLTLAVAAFGYVVALSNLDAGRYFSGMGLTFAKLLHQAPLLRWVMFFLLAAAAVLEDPAVGERAAWLTRPIRGRDLAVAKALFLLVAVGLPSALVSVGVALRLDAPLFYALTAGVGSLLLGLGVGAISATVAVVSENMLQALLTLAAAAFSLFLIGFVAFQVLHTKLPNGSENSPATSFLVGMAAVFGIAAAALGIQYARRSRRRTVALVAGLVLLALPAAHYWPWDFWPERTTAADGTPASALRLEQAGKLDYLVDSRPFAGSQATVTCAFELQGAPSDRVFSISAAHLKLRAGGETLSSEGMANSGRVFGSPYAGLSALGYHVPPPRAPHPINVAKLPVDQFQRLRGQAADIIGTVLLKESQYRLEAELPVQAGAGVIVQGRQAQISSISQVGAAYEVRFQYTAVNPVWRAAAGPWINQSYLINRDRGEFSPTRGGGRSGTGEIDLALLSYELDFAATYSLKTGQRTGAVDAAWLAGAKLCFFVARDIGARPVKLSVTATNLIVPLRPQGRHVIVIQPDGSREEFDL